MATSFFDTNSDPLAALNVDTSGQRAQLAQYSIMRAAGYLQNNKNDEALKEFKKALAFDSQNTTAQTYVGKLNLSKGNNFEAIKAFKAIVKSQPNSVDAHVNLANAYLQDKQYAESEKELKAAARLDPSNPLPDYTLGLQYAKTNRLGEAESQFRKVLKVAPRDGNVFYALGMVNNKQGRPEEAIVNLEKSILLKKNFPDANYELGVAYNSVGRSEDSKKQLSLLQSSSPQQAQDLQFIIKKPQILYMDQNNHHNFNQALGAGQPLWMLDPTLLTSANSSVKISVAIQFNNEMDAASVMTPSNWEISRANNVEGGFYTRQFGGSEVDIPAIPSFVSYNPGTLQADVTFTIKQNATKDATIDPSHLVFKFSGKDAAGRSMDTTADQIDGAAAQPF